VDKLVGRFERQDAEKPLYASSRLNNSILSEQIDIICMDHSTWPAWRKTTGNRRNCRISADYKELREPDELPEKLPCSLPIKNDAPSWTVREAEQFDIIYWTSTWPAWRKTTGNRRNCRMSLWTSTLPAWRNWEPKKLSYNLRARGVKSHIVVYRRRGGSKLIHHEAVPLRFAKCCYATKPEGKYGYIPILK
jgi:hypothetical protein